MKKLIALILILLMCISLFAACGGNEESPDTTKPADAPAPADTSESAEEPAKAPADTITFRFAHNNTEDSSIGQAALKFKELVEEKSSGTLIIEVYPNAQLGDEDTLLESIAVGMVDFAALSTGMMAKVVPDFQVFGLLCISMLVMLIVGVPVAVSLGTASILTLIADSSIPLQIVPQQMFSAVNSFSLLCVPFFLLAGTLMEEGGLTDKLVDFANALIGWLKCGLVYVSVLVGMLLGGVSGSSAADTAALSSVTTSYASDYYGWNNRRCFYCYGSQCCRCDIYIHYWFLRI